MVVTVVVIHLLPWLRAVAVLEELAAPALVPALLGSAGAEQDDKIRCSVTGWGSQSCAHQQLLSWGSQDVFHDYPRAWLSALTEHTLTWPR